MKRPNQVRDHDHLERGGLVEGEEPVTSLTQTGLRCPIRMSISVSDLIAPGYSLNDLDVSVHMACFGWFSGIYYFAAKVIRQQRSTT